MWRGGKLAIGALAGIVPCMTQAALSELLQLPKPQRLAVAERLWLSVADEASMPVPESHKRVLRKRLADYRAGALRTISHEELMRRVRES